MNKRKTYEALKDNQVKHFGSLKELAVALDRSFMSVYQAYKKGYKANGHTIRVTDYALCNECGMKITDMNRYEKKQINTCRFCYLRKCRESWQETKDFYNERRKIKRRKPKEERECIICEDRFQTAYPHKKCCDNPECYKKYKKMIDRIWRKNSSLTPLQKHPI